MPNHLVSENSPYLLQHANNPVDWYPWGEEALNKAKAENKPIFLSIGYAACHWCHVMAHESFEDEDTAKLMNEFFVNIKVDREERPDLDAIYMQATIAMTGSGGWPMSVFLTPDLKPFYADTYLPPTRSHNMPAFKDVLSGLANAWKNDRAEIVKVGEQLRSHLQHQAKIQIGETNLSAHLNPIVGVIQSTYDWGYGGWGDAPKFPQPMTLEFLLQHAVLNKNDADLKLIRHCLHAMARGGLYDVLGGGFSRYSIDQHWRIPHFEKMLYDNALLARVYLHAWQVTKESACKKIVQETLDFAAREMLNERDGFYSSLNADSEGKEGTFYIWTLAEIREILKEDSDFFEAAYEITAKGNWAGKIVLQKELDDDYLAARFGLNLEAVSAKLADAHTKLFAAREKRIRPSADDKVITAWNGLMLSTLAEAARIFGDYQKDELAKKYYLLATRNAEFLLSELRPAGKLRRAWRDGKTTNDVFLEDYAALALGLLELYQTDFDNRWFSLAKELTHEMIELFSDPEGGFFDTPNNGETLLIRPKEIQDNATPSGNALACEALIKLYALDDEPDYLARAEKTLELVTDSILRYPLGFGKWLSVAETAQGNMKQAAVLGGAEDLNFQSLLNAIRVKFRPNVVVAASPFPIAERSPALLKERILLNGKATAYLCEGFMCKNPTTEADIFAEQLNA